VANGVGNGGSGGVPVNAGDTVTVSEAAHSGTSMSNYSPALACDNNVTPAANGSFTVPAVAGPITCTFTNTHKTIGLTVKKALSPTNDTGLFDLSINGSVVANGVGNNGSGQATVSAGDKATLAEAAHSGTVTANYTSGLACDSGVTPAADGSFTVPVSGPVTCTFTNTRKTHVVRLNKVVDPTNDGGTFTLTAAGVTASNQGNGGYAQNPSAAVGSSVSVGEADGVAKLANYTSTLTCSGVSATGTTSAGFTMPDNDVTCTVINKRKTHSLTLTKLLLPSDDTGVFNLTAAGITAPNQGNNGFAQNPNTPVGTTVSVGEAAGTGTSLANYLSVLTCNGVSASGKTSASFAMPDTDVSCTVTNTRAGHAKVVKTVQVGPTAGPLTSADSFIFTLRSGAQPGVPGTILETGTATGGNAGIVTFATALNPGQHYQICEVVRAGWNTSLPNWFMISIPPADNSTVCSDFTVSPGQTVVFNVNNSRPPGGLSRTIGYWKNWSSCTNGGQTPELDKQLPFTIGNLNVNTCVIGVEILNKSDRSGKKFASDPAYNMAAQLTAAALNYGVGALRCTASDTAVNSGQALLQSIGFVGSGAYAGTMTSTQANVANMLATLLDGYNNNNVGWCALTNPASVPQAPSFTSANNLTVVSGSTGTLTVTAANATGVSVVGTLPTGVSFSNGVLSVGTTTPAGTYTITLKATGAWAFVTQTFTLIVQ